MLEINRDKKYKVLRNLHLKEIADLINIINTPELQDFTFDNIPFYDKSFEIKFDKVFDGQLKISCSDNRELELCIFNAGSYAGYSKKILFIYIALTGKDEDEYLDFSTARIGQLEIEATSRKLREHIEPPKYSKWVGNDGRDKIEETQLDWYMNSDRAMYLIKNATFTKRELSFLIYVLKERLKKLSDNNSYLQRIRINKETQDTKKD